MNAVTPQPALRDDQGFDAIVPNARRLSVSVVIRRLFRMATLFLAARMLGVEGFGTYALLLTIVEMTAIISGYGYVDFLTREIAQRPESAWPLGKRVTQLRLAYVVPSLGVALLLLAALRLPSSLLVDSAWLGLTLIPRAFGESAQGMLKGLQRFAPLPWIEFVQGVALLAAAPLFILRGLGIRGVILAELLGAVTGAVVAVWNLVGKLQIRDSDPRRLRDLLRSTFAFNIYPFITNLYDRVDVVLLSKLAGSFATGIYSIPYRVFATLQIIPYGVMGALLPVFSSSPMKREAAEACANAMRFLYLASLSIILLTLTFAGPVVEFALGPSYAGSIITIKILVWAGVPAFLNFALNTLLLAAHREKVFLWTAGICTAFNVAANTVMIPRFSFVGAAAITVATECLLLAQNIYLVRNSLGRVVLPKDGLKVSAVFAAVLAGSWGLKRVVPEFWAGLLACTAFAVFVVATSPSLGYFRAAPGHQGTK